jgi:hypothetical protein
MNRIYCVVWSRSLNQMVVASELTALPRRGLQGRAQTLRSEGKLCIGIVTALLAMAGMGGSPQAQAQAVGCGPAPYNFYNGTASCMGFNAVASGVGATALGANSQTDLSGGIAIGYQSYSSQVNAISIGRLAAAAGVNSV